VNLANIGTLSNFLKHSIHEIFVLSGGLWSDLDNSSWDIVEGVTGEFWILMIVKLIF
jgi:hypothetical protein